MKQYFKGYNPIWTKLWVWEVIFTSADDDIYDIPIYTYAELLEWFNEYTNFGIGQVCTLPTYVSLISFTFSPSIGYGEIRLNGQQFLLKM